MTVKMIAKKNHPNDGIVRNTHFYIVQALASQGDEIALVVAFATTTVDLLIVSPLLRGNNPYPCGSLTYRCLCNFMLFKASSQSLHKFSKGQKTFLEIIGFINNIEEMR
jgi:hypothetical protein